MWHQVYPHVTPDKSIRIFPPDPSTDKIIRAAGSTFTLPHPLIHSSNITMAQGTLKKSKKVTATATAQRYVPFPASLCPLQLVPNHH